MMIALLSPTLAGGAALPPWLPAGATAFLDFVNGTYYAGGAVQAVGTLLGGGFDAGEISGSGMLIFDGNGNQPSAAGALLSDLVAALPVGCTLVFDMDFVNPPYGWVMLLGDNTNWDTSVDGITIAADDNTYDAVSLGVGHALSGTGVHRLAVTLNRDVGGGDFEYAWCADGASADTQTVSYAIGWALNTAWIGSDGSGNDQLMDHVYFRSITLYPAVAPADLPALTS
ncbi:hypothetical protein [Mesorhizobium opportunistum]|uniref:Uncharacterized protein n=1 Tax=Mesorhizobium opportunistum (strain LMG 24607 / HAMBI 3007 / WSM2075) TaxID=536019 RepID=F7Y0Z5_MESOW|nr:hypothetical protein [Mesorhizobium opportunistum]AEH88208.1 hypothetical protein Mesop_3767 [Mesorhizobium opportunistum WSM2075]